MTWRGAEEKVLFELRELSVQNKMAPWGYVT